MNVGYRPDIFSKAFWIESICIFQGIWLYRLGGGGVGVIQRAQQGVAAFLHLEHQHTIFSIALYYSHLCVLADELPHDGHCASSVTSAKHGKMVEVVV